VVRVAVELRSQHQWQVEAAGAVENQCPLADHSLLLLLKWLSVA
jgi:hypothetical protein